MTAVSTVAHGSRAALRACWHPVAYAADVAAVPLATRPLAEPLVLWRDGGCLVARNDNLEQPDAVIQAFERTIAMRAHGLS